MKSLVLSCRESYSLNDCRSLLWKVPNSHIVYTFWESNQSADAFRLVWGGIFKRTELFFIPPDPVRGCVVRDISKDSNIRVVPSLS